MKDRIIAVITCWTQGCEKYEEYFVGVHNTFEDACKFVNEAINENGNTPVFDEVTREHGVQSTQIYEGSRDNDSTVYYIREQYI